jgi:glycosyltransferase involved in cell wall biosynthesis
LLECEFSVVKIDCPPIQRFPSLKILQVAYKSEITGGEKVLLNLANHLKSRGHHVLVACPSNGPLTKVLRGEGIGVRITPIEKTYNFMAAYRLRNLILQERIQVLHSHGMLVNIVGRIAAKMADIPVSISTVHLTRQLSTGERAENIWQWLKGKYYRSLDNFTAGFNDRVIAVSESVRKDLISQGVSSDKIVVIKNGIECESYQNPLERENQQAHKKRELGIGNEPVVGTITRFYKQKDVQTFLYAISDVIRDYPNLRCLIVGDGKQRRELEGLRSRLALHKNVTFLGYREDAREILDLFQIFVLSSLWEGLPLVVLEAMAGSKPVIATRVAGTAEAVVDGKTGILVPLRDSKRLAESIKTLLKDQKLAQKMGEAGRRRVHRHFRGERMVDETEKLYLDLMRSKKKTWGGVQFET